MLQSLILFLAYVLFSLQDVEAGMCLEVRQPNGNCIGVQYPNRTDAECCNQYGNYYTIENYSFEERFRIRISGSGFPNCLSCENWKKRLAKNVSSSTAEDKCKDVNCGPNKVCKFRHNTLTCVCQRPKCKRLPASPVCSNFNKTYRTECSLNRHACINNKQEYVAYDGQCRDSCKGVRCRDGMQCIELKDKTKMPYCVKCDSRLCSLLSSNSSVCGADNVTYSSYCELRMATCRRGKTIGIAYIGPCKAQATCSNVVCPKDMRCLKDINSPRCVRCNSKCTSGDMDLSSKSPTLGQICGTDRETYSSLCAMRKNSCRTGKFISMLHRGRCKPGNCSSIVCNVGETCLMDEAKPRCAICSMAHCMTIVKLALKKDANHPNARKMCGTDQNTYPNLCALRKQACKTGKYISIQHAGECQGSNSITSNKTSTGRPNDQSYKPITNKYIDSLKNKTVSLKQLMSMLQTFGLKVHLEDRSNQQAKTVDAYPFFCHMLRSDFHVAFFNPFLGLSRNSSLFFLGRERLGDKPENDCEVG